MVKKQHGNNKIELDNTYIDDKLKYKIKTNRNKNRIIIKK